MCAYSYPYTLRKILQMNCIIVTCRQQNYGLFKIFSLLITFLLVNVCGFYSQETKGKFYFKCLGALSWKYLHYLAGTMVEKCSYGVGNQGLNHVLITFQLETLGKQLSLSVSVCSFIKCHISEECYQGQKPCLKWLVQRNIIQYSINCLTTVALSRVLLCCGEMILSSWLLLTCSVPLLQVLAVGNIVAIKDQVKMEIITADLA